MSESIDTRIACGMALLDEKRLAGRDLDRTVAKDIFGIDTEQREWCEVWVPSRIGTGFQYDERCVRCGTHRGGSRPRGRSGPCLIGYPRFSSEIGAAWTVVERLRELGLMVMISSEPDGWEVEICVTEALAAQGYRGVYSKHGPAPLAICEAAVYALSAARSAPGDGEAVS